MLSDRGHLAVQVHVLKTVIASKPTIRTSLLYPVGEGCSAASELLDHCSLQKNYRVIGSFPNKRFRSDFLRDGAAVGGSLTVHLGKDVYR